MSRLASSSSLELRPERARLAVPTLAALRPDDVADLPARQRLVGLQLHLHGKRLQAGLEDPVLERLAVGKHDLARHRAVQDDLDPGAVGTEPVGRPSPGHRDPHAALPLSGVAQLVTESSRSTSPGRWRLPPR